jgi:hypothetical protein
MNDQPARLEYSTLSAALPRVWWWVGVLGLAVGILRIGEGPVHLWHIFSDQSWHELGRDLRVTVLLYVLSSLLGGGLVVGAALLLSRKSEAASLIVLVEKLYLVLLGATLLWTVANEFYQGVDSEGLWYLFYTAQSSVALAIYPVLAIVLLAPEAAARDPDDETGPL